MSDFLLKVFFHPLLPIYLYLHNLLILLFLDQYLIPGLYISLRYTGVERGAAMPMRTWLLPRVSSTWTVTALSPSPMTMDSPTRRVRMSMVSLRGGCYMPQNLAIQFAASW